MTKLNPNCPICQGIGWYQAPYYSDFGPRVEMYPCPECHDLQAPTKAEGILMAVGFAVIFIALLVWGAR